MGGSANAMGRLCQPREQFRWPRTGAGAGPGLAAGHGAGAAQRRQSSGSGQPEAQIDAPARAPQDYQALLLRAHLEAVLANGGVAGISLWQFSDIVVDRAVMDEGHRPRGLNNKGIVSLNRSAKVAFHAVRQLMLQEQARQLSRLPPHWRDV